MLVARHFSRRCFLVAVLLFIVQTTRASEQKTAPQTALPYTAFLFDVGGVLAHPKYLCSSASSWLLGSYQLLRYTMHLSFDLTKTDECSSFLFVAARWRNK